MKLLTGSKIIGLVTLFLFILLSGCASRLDVRIDRYIFEWESTHWKAKFDYSYKQVFYDNP